MFDVSYTGRDLAARKRRLQILEAQKLTLTESASALVAVVDGASMQDGELEAEIHSAASTKALVLVLFELSHGVSFRERRDDILALGAADVMNASAPDEEFLTRVKALLHRSRPPSILVVEDEQKIGDWAVDVLRDAGMEANRVGTLADAQTEFESRPIDALVVDRGLPDGDGLDFVTRLRDMGIRTPALLFTALDDIEDRIKGLEDARADDYLCKPVHEDELRARVHVLLRPMITAETLVFGPLEICRKDRIIRWRGHRVELRRKECEMLIYLAERVGLPIPKRMIYLDVWGKTFMDIGSNPVTTARHRMVKDIKETLKELGDEYPEFIGTDGDAYVFDPKQLLRLSAVEIACS